jgi:hypothetical protein
LIRVAASYQALVYISRFVCKVKQAFFSLSHPHTLNSLNYLRKSKCEREQEMLLAGC